MNRILVKFEDIKPGQMVYEKADSELAIFRRSNCDASETLWGNTLLWIDIEEKQENNLHTSTTNV